MGRPMLSFASGKAMVFFAVLFPTVRWRVVECTIKSRQQAWHESRRSAKFFKVDLRLVFLKFYSSTPKDNSCRKR